MTKPNLTREDWLLALTAALKPLFVQHAATLPTKLRVSCGWPSRSATASKARRIGECWTPKASADVTTEIFISPCLADAVRVADVLVHELCHAAVGIECGHKGAFAKLARAIGLEGKLTATVASAALAAELKRLADAVGPYPHAELNGLERPGKKQTTRLVKIVCPECEYTCRTTAKWLEVGLPTCCCGADMLPAS